MHSTLHSISWSKLFYWWWWVNNTKSTPLFHLPCLLSSLPQRINFSRSHHQNKNSEGSVLLGSTAAFPPGVGSLHTQSPAMLESDHHTESDHRKYCSISRGWGYRTPSRLTDRWDAEKPHSLRLNEIIRNQSLQRVLQVIIQALP